MEMKLKQLEQEQQQPPAEEVRREHRCYSRCAKRERADRHLSWYGVRISRIDRATQNQKGEITRCFMQSGSVYF